MESGNMGPTSPSIVLVTLKGTALVFWQGFVVGAMILGLYLIVRHFAKKGQWWTRSKVYLKEKLISSIDKDEEKLRQQELKQQQVRNGVNGVHRTNP